MSYAERWGVPIDPVSGYVKEPEVEGEEGPSIMDYLEAAYGVERAESLTIQMWKDLQQAGHLAFKLTELKDTAVLFNDSTEVVYGMSNEIESLVDSVELALSGDSTKEGAREIGE